MVREVYAMVIGLLERAETSLGDGVRGMVKKLLPASRMPGRLMTGSRPWSDAGLLVVNVPLSEFVQRQLEQLFVA